MKILFCKENVDKEVYPTFISFLFRKRKEFLVFHGFFIGLYFFFFLIDETGEYSRFGTRFLTFLGILVLGNAFYFWKCFKFYYSKIEFYENVLSEQLVFNNRVLNVKDFRYSDIKSIGWDPNESQSFVILFQKNVLLRGFNCFWPKLPEKVIEIINEKRSDLIITP